MDGKSCARVLVIAGFTRIHAATDIWAVRRAAKASPHGMAYLAPREPQAHISVTPHRRFRFPAFRPCRWRCFGASRPERDCL
jgi:hypothetical protein